MLQYVTTKLETQSLEASITIRNSQNQEQAELGDQNQVRHFLILSILDASSQVLHHKDWLSPPITHLPLPLTTVIVCAKFYWQEIYLTARNLNP